MIRNRTPAICTTCHAPLPVGAGWSRRVPGQGWASWCVPCAGHVPEAPARVLVSLGGASSAILVLRLSRTVDEATYRSFREVVGSGCPGREARVTLGEALGVLARLGNVGLVVEIPAAVAATLTAYTAAVLGRAGAQVAQAEKATRAALEVEVKAEATRRSRRQVGV